MNKITTMGEIVNKHKDYLINHTRKLYPEKYYNDFIIGSKTIKSLLKDFYIIIDINELTEVKEIYNDSYCNYDCSDNKKIFENYYISECTTCFLSYVLENYIVLEK